MVDGYIKPHIRTIEDVNVYFRNNFTFYDDLRKYKIKNYNIEKIKNEKKLELKKSNY